MERLNKLYKYAQHFTKLELLRAKLDVFQNESGREGVDFIITTKSGNYHELFLQTLELDKQRSIKIPKLQLGELKDNLWIALVLFMEEEELGLFLIPSKTFTTPDDYIFKDNPQSEMFAHLSNWEIKVFTNGMDELNNYLAIISSKWRDTAMNKLFVVVISPKSRQSDEIESNLFVHHKMRE